MPHKPRFSITKAARGRDRPWVLNIPAAYSPTGIRQRRYFRTRGEAEASMHFAETRYKNFGAKGLGASLEDLAALDKAKAILAPHGVSVIDAARDYAGRIERQGKSLRVSELFDKYIEEKQAGLRQRSLGDLRTILKRLRPLIGDEFASEIDAHALAEAFTELALPPSRWNLYRRNLGPVFKFALHEGWIDATPIPRLRTKSTGDVQEVRIMTIAQARSLLEATDEKTMPFFAIGLFAGIRPMEAERLCFSNIDFEENRIVVPSGKSKTGRPRIVNLADNLKHILLSYQGREGIVYPGRAAYDRVRDAAGLKAIWVEDWMRHSFASYWLKQFGLESLREQLGHTNTAITFRHYINARATKEEAEQFWRIGLDG